MKVAILGDVHISARNDSIVFNDYFIRFFEQQFIPYCLSNGINHVIQLGDIFDRRKYMNFNTLSMWKERVFDVLEKHEIHLDIIIGNHDTYYRNSNRVNSPDLLLSEFSNISVFIDPTEVEIGNTKVLYVPWINSGNADKTFEVVKKTKASVAMGHFEFSGFEMYKGHVAEDGLSKDKFKKFETILSGHYHHKSDDGQVFYLGIPYEIVWSDAGSPHGFHTWDSDSLELNFIENNDKMFYKVAYDDAADDEFYEKVNYAQFEGKYIKVVVVNKKNLYGYDQFLSKLYSKNPAEVKIIEDMSDLDGDNVLDDEIELEDTQTILETYIEAIDFSHDKDKLKRMMKALYLEALHLEEA